MGHEWARRIRILSEVAMTVLVMACKMLVIFVALPIVLLFAIAHAALLVGNFVYEIWRGLDL